MNQFYLVGRIAALPQLQTNPAGWKTCNILLDVERPFANSHGSYESDLLSIEVWRGAAETLCATAQIGSWVTIRGRIMTNRNKYEETSMKRRENAFITWLPKRSSTFTVPDRTKPHLLLPRDFHETPSDPMRLHKPSQDPWNMEEEKSGNSPICVSDV